MRGRRHYGWSDRHHHDERGRVRYGRTRAAPRPPAPAARPAIPTVRCPACGAEIPLIALDCPVCGAETLPF
jgi:hypothetical protein